MSDNVTKPTSDIQAVHGAYTLMVDDLEKLVIRAEDIIGRLYGEHPTVVEMPVMPPSMTTGGKSTGLVADMNTVCSRFAALMDRAKSVVAKIEGAV